MIGDIIVYVVVLICVLSVIRNYFVFRERNRVVDIVREKTTNAIYEDKYSDKNLWRFFNWYDNNYPAYDKMLLQFWKPVKSFIKENPIPE